MTPNGMHRPHGVEFNTVVLGSRGVGKSSMIQRFITGQFSRGYTPTIEQKYRKEMKVNGTDYTLVVLDTMGHEDRSTILDRYTLQQHGVLVVFDLSNEDSFKIAEQLAESLSSRLIDEPIILVGNKSDCSRVIDEEEPERVVNDYGLREYIECSASNDENSVNSVFELLISEIIEQEEEDQSQINQEVPLSYSSRTRNTPHTNQPPGMYNRHRAERENAVAAAANAAATGASSTAENQEHRNNTDNNRRAGGGGPGSANNRQASNRRSSGQNQQNRQDGSECVVM